MRERNIVHPNRIRKKLPDAVLRKESDFISNVEKLRKNLEGAPDIVLRSIRTVAARQIYVLFVKNIVDLDLLQRDIMRPLMEMGDSLFSTNKEEGIRLPVADLQTEALEWDQLILHALQGNVVLIMEDLDYIVLANLSKTEKRSIEEPPVEKNIKGPHEGFVESIDTNLGILRSKIKGEALRYKTITLGTLSRQMIAIAYMQGIADEGILQDLKDKIERINIDAIQDTGYIQQMIADFPASPFPQHEATERPDKVISGLLEGRFAIMVDGTPITLVVPATYVSFFQAMDDFSGHWIFGTLSVLLRESAMLISVFLSSLYIAVLTYHYYVIPIDLLIPLAESRHLVPFPPVVEVLMMEFAVELIREAAIRLPSYIATSIGVVGGIVLGQAAVQAGIVSEILVIVIAVTAIASYTTPNHDMANAMRVVKLFTIFITAFFGMVGWIVSVALFLAHLLSLESLGQPYLQPIIPLKIKDIKDSFIRLPLKTMGKRPDFAAPLDRRRGRND